MSPTIERWSKTEIVEVYENIIGRIIQANANDKSSSNSKFVYCLLTEIVR